MFSSCTYLGSRPTATGLSLSPSHSGRNCNNEAVQRQLIHKTRHTHRVSIRKGPLCLIDAQELPICLSGKTKSVFCLRFLMSKSVPSWDDHRGEKAAGIPQTALMSGAQPKDQVQWGRRMDAAQSLPPPLPFFSRASSPRTPLHKDT